MHPQRSITFPMLALLAIMVASFAGPHVLHAQSPVLMEEYEMPEELASLQS